jgi:hypothetical protein
MRNVLVLTVGGPHPNATGNRLSDEAPAWELLGEIAFSL